MSQVCFNQDELTGWQPVATKPNRLEKLVLHSILLALLFLESCSAENFIPKFGDFPRLAITAEEIRAKRATDNFEAIKTAAIRRAEPHIDKPIHIPTDWGNWIFYYANPKTGGRLVALDLEKHKDPATGEIFTDQRIVESYRTILHNKVNSAAVSLGWAFLWTGEDKYAEAVKRILAIYAKVYHTFPKRADRWGNSGFLAKYGGRRYSQSLSEAVGVIELCKAYDLTRNSKVWTQEDIKLVESKFFRPTADTLLYTTFAHNHQTWLNAGVMCISSVLGDAQLVNRILHMKRGFFYQLRQNIDADGMWNEGTMAYHSYALQALVATVDAGRRIGIPLHKEKKFRSMIEAPLKYCYPDGRFPAINDSDPSNIRSFFRYFRWAWEVYKDPSFAQAWANGDKKRLAQLLGPGAEIERVYESKSSILKGIGLLVLRRGKGRSAINVMLDYGAHGAAHGQRDKMNLILYANGREWLFDPGRLNYRHKEYKTYYTQTASHNTVMINGRSQAPDNGTLLFFDETDIYSSAAGESRGAYKDAVLRRFLFLTDSFLVELFEVESEKPATMDWLGSARVPSLLGRAAEDAEGRSFPPIRSEEEKMKGANAAPTAPPLGEKGGYQHFMDVSLVPDALPIWDFMQSKDQLLRLWLDSKPDGQILVARRFGYNKSQRNPCLIRRIGGKTASFLTVYDLSGNGKAVKGVSLNGERKAVVKCDDKEWRIRFESKGVDVKAGK